MQTKEKPKSPSPKSPSPTLPKGRECNDKPLSGFPKKGNWGGAFFSWYAPLATL